ncbi:hypothetical protein PRK78_005537 [Emydomyces testavorans]|uniref:Uncharacterized protein n=1 Tax=Emydomyces testavorans TaxID=2070801 RepID=A0AAF0DKW2_9EURO|nr:hypothetical protein PRK78_005537 [Emydomyces testavorans]
MSTPLSPLGYGLHNASCLPRTGYLSPPPSPTKRRLELRDSEETDGDMTIEAYVLVMDPYRSATLQNPLPHPVFHAKPNENLRQQIQPLYTRMRQIVSADREFEEISFALNTVTKPGYPGGDQPTQILFVNVNDSGDGKYGPLKDELRSLISASGFGNLDIEVLDPRKSFAPSLSPIDPRDPAVEKYKRCKEDLLEILREQIKRDWRMISLFRTGRQGKLKPAVVVMVRPRAHHNWSGLYHALKNRLRTEFTSQDFDVEIMPGECYELRPGGSGLSFHERMDEDCLPKMGSSIGLPGEQGGGTLGGFISLKRGEKVHNGFLTNAVRKGMDRYGTSYFTSQTDPSRTEIQYMAKSDVQASIEAVKKSISAFKEDLAKLHEENEQRLIIGDRPPIHYNDRVKVYNESLRKFSKMLSQFESMPCTLGNVLVPSGRWAFVELTGPLATQVFRLNIIPNIPSGIIENYIEGARVFAQSGQPVSGFGRIEKGQWYFKVGRTTDITYGVCNGVAADCCWPDSDQERYDSIGKGVAPPPRNETKELVIISKKLNTPSHTQESFCRPGDSGSWVIDANGKLCGLLFGEMRGWCGPGDDTGAVYVGSGLVTCMSVVSESVKQKTFRKPFGAKGESGELTLQYL